MDDMPRYRGAKRFAMPPPNRKRKRCEICCDPSASVCEWDGYTVALCFEHADEWWRLRRLWDDLTRESENG